MKTINKIFILLAVSFLQISCQQDDVFSGAPDPTTLEFTTLPGTVSTTATSLVSGQPFPVTVSIAPMTFDVDVSIEVIAFLPNINKRSRKAFIIKAGQTSISGTMNAPGADQGSVILPFSQELKLYLSAINSVAVVTEDGTTPLGFAGKQYTISSNTISLDYGDSAFGAVNSNRLAIRFDWANPPNGGNPFNNNLNLRLKKDGVVTTVSPNSQATQPIYGTTVSTARYEAINFLSTAVDGTYTLEVFAIKLTADPIDLPFRFTVRFPNESVETFSGVLTGLTLGSAATAIPKLQVIKTTDGNGAHYDVSLL